MVPDISISCQQGAKFCTDPNARACRLVMDPRAEPLMLTFHGPFGLMEGEDNLFTSALAMQSGIYVWTVPYVHGGYLITYVGQTGATFGRRNKEHMIQTIGGNYRISDPDLLLQGVDHVLWNGLWRKGTRDKIDEYLHRVVDLVPAIRKTLTTIRVLVAPLDAAPPIRRRIEGALADHIKRQPPPAAALLPPDIRYGRRQAAEELIDVQILCAVEVLGLPAGLKA